MKPTRKKVSNEVINSTGRLYRVSSRSKRKRLVKLMVQGMESVIDDTRYPVIDDKLMKHWPKSFRSTKQQVPNVRFTFKGGPRYASQLSRYSGSVTNIC